MNVQVCNVTCKNEMLSIHGFFVFQIIYKHAIMNDNRILQNIVATRTEICK